MFHLYAPWKHLTFLGEMEHWAKINYTYFYHRSGHVWYKTQDLVQHKASTFNA